LRRGRDYFDYRPGLPLHLFVADFTKPEEHRANNKFVGSVEQMHASRCYQASRDDKKLGCISCHDPHEAPSPETKIAYYRDRCLQCHGEGSCTLPTAERRKQSKEDSCVQCHMPRAGAEITHTSITDHRIPRKPDAAPPATTWPRSGQVPLVPFHPDLAGVKDDVDRELGLAFIKLSEQQPDAMAKELGGMALPLLEKSTADAGDLAAWEAKGNALWLQGRLGDAMSAFETVLNREPRHETTLFLAATLAARLKQVAAAQAYVDRLLEVNPWRWEYHQLSARVLAQRQDWPATVTACAKALELNPMNPAARQMLILALIRRGDRTRAEKEFTILTGLIPAPQRDALRQWFTQQVR
jgi:predicted CXXCH cytochrome family protein